MQVRTRETSCAGLDAGTNCRKTKKPDTEHPAAGRDGGPGTHRLLAAVGLSGRHHPGDSAAALAAEVFWPCEIYDHAPADVRDGLIHALLSTENSSEASNLMSCLAMQGDDKAMETLLELELKSPTLAQGPLCEPVQLCADWRLDPLTSRVRESNSTSTPAIP